MNKLKKLTCVIAMVLFFALANTSTSTEAKSPDIAPNSWNKGTEVVIDTVTNPVPSGYQMFGKGVKITSPGEICHEFRSGQFKWIADIHRMVNSNWVKVPITTQGWVPDEEGTYMACAQADAAGTYALFGYYTGPSERAFEPSQTPPLSPVCDVNPFTMDGYIVNYIGEGYDYDYRFDFDIDSATLPQTFTFSILSHTPADSTIQISGNATITYYFYSTFNFHAQSDDLNIDPISIRVETDTCHFDLTLSEIGD
jgi:hypothetical protein